MTARVIELSEALARTAAHPDTPPSPLSHLSQATGQDIGRAFAILAEHRLDLVVHSRLSSQERELLPPGLEEHLSSTYQKTRNHQGLLELTFAQLTHALAAQNIAPIACKGIVLAKDYYHPKGIRPMQDIDLWVPHSSVDRVRKALSGVGFAERKEKETNHALYFENRMGLLLDVHHHMALFEKQGIDPFALTMDPTSGWHRVFRPEALLVHLVYHLLGHTSQVGILLGWVLDIALVVNKHQERIDWTETRSLCPSERVWKVLMRLIAFARGLGWCSPIEALQSELAAARPITYATIVRLRHLTPLGLTTPRGWARLLKRLAGSNKAAPPLPPLSDLPRGLGELFAEGTRFRQPDCALVTGQESNRH